MITVTLTKAAQCILAPGLGANLLDTLSHLETWHDLRDLLQDLPLPFMTDTEKQGALSKSDSSHKVMLNAVPLKWPLSWIILLQPKGTCQAPG